MDIAGKSLVALRNHYRHYLFEEYLPFWDKYGIDHELGGFICALDHTGVGADDHAEWYCIGLLERGGGLKKRSQLVVPRNLVDETAIRDIAVVDQAIGDQKTARLNHAVVRGNLVEGLLTDGDLRLFALGH